MEATTSLIVVYWLCVSFVVYTYIGYPAILWVLTLWKAKPVRHQSADYSSPVRNTVSVVLTAYNEEKSIGRRLTELLGHFDTHGLSGEIIVVSDGSTDRTTEIVRAFSDQGGLVPVRLIVLPTNGGKAVALSAGCAAASSDVLVFADARQRWAPDSIVRLLSNFEDPRIGAVSGELKIERGVGVIDAIGFYWKYEKWLRRRESQLHSTVGVTGAICAVRRVLFRPIPAGTILDDVYWPLCVVMQGHRVVFDKQAHAYDRLPEKIGSEYRRKVRTLSGNFQLACRLPSSLLPWRNPVWFSFVSHKLARLVVPWAVLVSFIVLAFLDKPEYRSLLVLQTVGLVIAFCGLIPAVVARSRIASAAGALLVLNAAAWWAFWVWALGKSSRTWTKTTYRTNDPVLPHPSSIHSNTDSHLEMVKH